MYTMIPAKVVTAVAVEGKSKNVLATHVRLLCRRASISTLVVREGNADFGARLMVKADSYVL